MKRCYGPAPFDRSQIFSFSYVLNLPEFGTKYLGNKKLARTLGNGWKGSGLFQAMTGAPIGNNYGSEYAADKDVLSIWGDGITLSGAAADGTPDEVAVPKLI